MHHKMMTSTAVSPLKMQLKHKVYCQVFGTDDIAKPQKIIDI